jgi:hypothetical protein
VAWTRRRAESLSGNVCLGKRAGLLDS